MDKVLESCKVAFDCIPRPFGISEVRLDAEGRPVDAVIRYLNVRMAAVAKCTPSDLLGKNIYEVWPDGDFIWLDRFYRAAFLGEPSEFETVNKAFKGFQNVVVFPICEGYCGYEVQDVTKWIEHAHPAMESILAGMFFYEPGTGYLLLSDPARECCGLEEGYCDIRDFVDFLFPDTSQDRILASFLDFDSEYDRILCEERTRNGRWVRFSMSHGSPANRFAIGFLEDITVLRETEEKSERRSEIIESLSAEYYALYIVNLKADRISPYLFRNNVAEYYARGIEEGASYSEWLERYCREYVVGEDRDEVCCLLGKDHLMEHMPDSGGELSVLCKRLFDDEAQYIELRLIRVSGAADEFVLAARNVNNEMRDQIVQKEALQSALVLAQHASEAKTTFLTNISHDFRTPLNSIVGFANLALARPEDAGRVRNALEKILLSSEHLLDLINDILDVSRIESGKIAIDEQAIDLNQLMDELKNVFMVQAIDCGVGFVVDVSGMSHSRVLGDRLRLNQILVNTVGNALKYTDRGGSVRVAVVEGPMAPGGAVLFEFSVEDTGCGMSEDFVNRIFMPFERDSAAGAHDAEGTGLGMTITKNLVDLLGGSIDVRSRLGEGSEFIITIPLKLEEADSVGREGEPEASPVEPAAFDGMRVLVVDDDELSREMMDMMLRDRGFEVQQATDGDEAVAAMEAVPEGWFDAIIMDMRMPRMSGDEAARAIRALPRADVADLPIIAMTADAFEEAHRRAREAGMTAHITKPLNMVELFSLLEGCLRPEA